MASEIRLSAAQERIARHDSGHLHIVACPGSGKTEAVSRRVVELIRKGAEPKKIVAFTFTEKAAGELKMRIQKRIREIAPRESDFGDMYVGTIDAFCLYVLKELKPEYRSFEVLDSARRIAFVDRWYRDLNLGRLQADNGLKKWETIKRFCRSVDRVLIEGINMSLISDAAFVECYENYMAKLKRERFFDFVSIIHTLLGLLRDDRDALRRLNDDVKHVVFDEYQDVNQLQEDLLRFLSMGSESVCVVGDDDQNIFQWRGSSIRHIIDFPKKYAKYGVRTEHLDTNYRATDGLIEVANRLILHNEDRVDKNMSAFDKQSRVFEKGDIVHNHFDTDRDEFAYIVQCINNLRDTDFTDKHGQTYALSYRDMAVIVKTNEDAARIISFFEQHDIPCVADSGSSVFDRPVVNLALDCISHVFSCAGYKFDDVPEMADLVSRYKEHVHGDAAQFDVRLRKVKDMADRIFERGSSDWLPGLGLQEFFQRILNAMGSEEGVFDEEKLYHLGVLSAVISDYEYVYQTLRASQVRGLKWFIIGFAEDSYGDPSHNDPALVDAVRVLTIWKAKGLEFPVVFVPTFVSRRRPPRETFFVDDGLYDRERYDGNVEDDRRGYYTAITRSQKYLFLTGARQRRITVGSRHSVREIRPHPFIAELSNDRVSHLRHVEKSKSKHRPMIQAEGVFPTSYSELSTYDQCPHDYKFRHVLGFNAGVPSAFGYGTNIHNIMNLIHSDFIRHRSAPTDHQIDDIFDRMFYLRFAPGRQNETMKKAASVVVKNYVNLHKGDFGRILETEKRFEFVMGKALISGDIDLLKKADKDGVTTGEVEIIDFKTEKQKDGRYDLDHSEQVRFYAYASMKSLGQKPTKAVIHHLDENRKDSVDISAKVLEDTAKRIDAKVERILSGDFEATPDDTKCSGCDFRALCAHKKFEVGVDFKPAVSAKPSGTDTHEEAQGGAYYLADPSERPALGPSVISSNIGNRAKKIAAGRPEKNKDGSYTIRSESEPGKSYTVTGSNCQCMGFKKYPSRHPGTTPTCSHIEAVKILDRKKAADRR